MLKKERYQKVLEILGRNLEDVDSELNFENNYQLLIAVVLSAQCTDKRINQVTPALFKRYPNAQALAETTADEVFEYIRSVSYPNSKAKYLVGIGQQLVERYDGEVPSGMEALTTLPGVGRKTANVIEAIAFGKAALAVDTHVFRVSHRVGLVPARCKTPYAVEVELKKNIPEELVAKSHYWLLLHGRYVCLARKPLCEKCDIQSYCRSYPKILSEK